MAKHYLDQYESKKYSNLEKKYSTSVLGVILRVMAILAIVELFIMFVLSSFSLPAMVENFFDPVCLILISAPLVYFFVVKPFYELNEELCSQVGEMIERDSLTNLLNARAFAENFKSLSAECARHNLYGAVLFLDVDRFKEINDIYGHAGGDQVLIEATKRFQATLRAEDLAYRIGGDEFLVLLKLFSSDKEASRGKAFRAAERITEAMMQPIALPKGELIVGVSIGISLVTPSTRGSEEVIKFADMAMQQAKKSLNSKIIVFDDPIVGE